MANGKQFSSLSQGAQDKFVSWWDMDILNTGDSALDRLSIGNLSPGNLVNSPVWVPGDSPSGISDVSGSLNFTSNSYVTIPTSTLLLNARGIGTHEFGTAYSTCGWVKGYGTGSRGLLTGTSSYGLCLVDGKPTFLYGSNFSASSAISSSVWTHVGWTVGAELLHRLWVNGVVVHTFSLFFGLDFSSLGGSSVTPSKYLNGKMSDWHIYDRELLDHHFADIMVGNPLEFNPVRRYKLDDGSGILAKDSSRRGNTLTNNGSIVPTDGVAIYSAVDKDPVRQINDISGSGNSPTATSTKRPQYLTDPLIPLIGTDKGVRFSYEKGHNLQKSAALGSSVSSCTIMLVGRMLDVNRVFSNTASLAYLFGISNNGVYGTNSADNFLGIRYVSGSESSQTKWEWQAVAKGTGGTIKIAPYGNVEPLNHTIALRFEGGISLSLWINGEKVAETTTGIPATLNLSGLLEMGSVNSGATSPSGWEHYDAVMYNSALPDDTMRFLNNYFSTQVEIPEVKRTTVYFVPPGFNGSNPRGFNLGASGLKLANGDILIFWTSGATDPADTMQAMYARSTDGGLTWQTAQVLHDTAIATYFLFSSVIQLANGDILAFTSTSPAATGDDWKSYMFRSSDNGNTWTPPAFIPCVAGYNYMSPVSRPFEITPGGEIWMPFYGYKISSSNYSSFILTSSDGGNNWIFKVDFANSAGSPSLYTVETTWVNTEGTNWTAIHRVSYSPTVHFSTNNATNWSAFQYLGSVDELIVTAEPYLYKCETIPGKLLLFRTIRTNKYVDIRDGICVNSSTDGGHSWGPCYMVHSDTTGRGYPTAFYVGNGRVALSFTGAMSEIVYMEFDEDLFP